MGSVQWAVGKQGQRSAVSSRQGTDERRRSEGLQQAVDSMQWADGGDQEAKIRTGELFGFPSAASEM